MKSRFPFAFGAATFWLVQTISAAAFDCGQASTDYEKVVCSDHSLVTKDEQLNVAYRQLMAALSPKERKALSNDQRAWINLVPPKCNGAIVCISDWIEKRTKTLLRQPDYGMNPGGRMVVRYEAGISNVDQAGAVEVFTKPKMGFERIWNAESKRLFEIDGESRTLHMVYGSQKLVSGFESISFDGAGKWTERGLNLKVPSGEELSFSEVFASDAVETIYLACEKQADAGGAWTDEMRSRLRDQIADLQNWQLSPKGASISIPPYSIAGWQQPLYGCELTAQELHPLAHDSFELWR